MKKITLFSLIFIVFLYCYQLEAQTLTFTSDAGAAWSDGIAEDGDGGSTNIAGLTLAIYNVDDALNNIGFVEWYSDTGLATSDGFNGLTTFSAPNFGDFKGQIIREVIGQEFQINGFDWYDWGNNNSQPMTVLGFRDGAQVASTTFTGNANPNRVSVSLGPDFDNVDEVRIITTSGSTYPSINNIEIGNAVLSTEDFTQKDFKISSINNKFVSNQPNTKIEVYNILGKKVENYNLPSNIYLIKASLENGKTIVVKRYLR